jgi:hypothetical protein
MNIVRLVSLATALVITATPWAALSSLHSQSVQAVVAPATGHVSDDSLPVIVITARRQS